MLDEYDKQLKKSLWLELSLSDKKGLDYVCESRGSINYIDQYIKCFRNAIFLKIGMGLFNNEFTITTNIFKRIPNCFFNEVKWKITYVRQKEYNISGGVNLKGCVLAKNGKLMSLNGEFIFKGRWEKHKERFGELIAHEILHAYEHWNRLKNNAEGLHDLAKRTGYYQNNRIRFKAKNEGDWVAEDISNVLYYCTPHERRALVAELNRFIDNNRDIIFDSEDGFKVMEKSSKYQTFKIVGHNLQLLTQNCDIMKEKIESTFLNIKGIKSNYKSILNYLNRIYDKSWFDIRKRVSRYMRSVYEENDKIDSLLSEHLLENGGVKKHDKHYEKPCE